MDWRAEYNRKLCTAEEAAARIRSHDTVALGHAMSEPGYLVDALCRHCGHLEDVKIIHAVSYGENPYCRPGMERHFSFNGMFLGPNTRECVAAGRGDYTPICVSEMPLLFRSGTVPVTAAMVMMSRPDENGYCYVGVASDFTMEIMRQAKTVIAECNDQVPRTCGDNYIHVSELDCIVETSHRIPEVQPIAVTDTERAIARYVSDLIEDGSTLQVGIGGIPNAIMGLMKNKRNLGIHSEMISDWIVELTESGVINGREKTLYPGKSIATFVMGTKTVYDYVDRNPSIAIYEADFVNNPAVIARNRKMVAVNACTEVDLFGQIASETAGGRQVSGSGGQLDFFRGANAGFDGAGKSIIAIRSTYTDREGRVHSRIRPWLEEKTVVTTGRNDIGYVVTEYGAAPLRWQSAQTRARNLIRVAHPDFRDELIEAFERHFKTRYPKY